MATLRQRYGYLPDALRIVLEAAGEDAMLRLVQRLGGVRVNVPAQGRLVPGSRFAQAMEPGANGTPALAIAAAAALRAAGYVHVDVPLMRASMTKVRRARIVEMRQVKGLNVQDIADAVGVTERAVYLALKENREKTPDDRQLDMFSSSP